jgi:aryl-alcohol dehydrogenase-like predicted oxidoreductase
MSKALYAEITYVNKPVSRIFYGMGGKDFWLGRNENELLDEIFAAGINAFDTARVYGFSEKTLGRWMQARGSRDQVVILSKCGHPDLVSHKKRITPKEIQKDFAASCRYLQTGYIDIYLLHRDDPDVEVGPLVDVFNELHSQKKIGAFGGSNWTHPRIQAANDYAERHGLVPFSVSSPNFGLAEQVGDPFGGGVSISGPGQAEARAWYRETQMPVVAYSSLGAGLFSGRLKADELEKAASGLASTAMKGFGHPRNFERLRRAERLAQEKGCSVPQIALAWIFHQPVNTFPVVSTKKAARMQENVRALEIDLSVDEIRCLNLEQ